jgi:hypothetical protein
LVAAPATTITRIDMRQVKSGGRYDNFFQNFSKRKEKKRENRAEVCIRITIGTTCHTCHRCHLELGA